jgi:hypothetical protein
LKKVSEVQEFKVKEKFLKELMKHVRDIWSKVIIWEKFVELKNEGGKQPMLKEELEQDSLECEVMGLMKLRVLSQLVMNDPLEISEMFIRSCGVSYVGPLME